MMILWRYLLGPLLTPILTLPMTLVAAFARPLQLITVLVLTGLYAWHVEAILIGTVLWLAWYSWSVLVPPRAPAALSAWYASYGGLGGQAGTGLAPI